MEFENIKLTIADFAETILLQNEYDEPGEYDIENMGIKIATLDSKNEKIFVPIKKFIIKQKVQQYYTDGYINVTGNHKFVENGTEIFAKNHPDFKIVNCPMYVVDFEVGGDHTYLANGRLNHNTTSGGKAIAFHSSVRLRLKALGQIKTKIKGVEQTIGIKTRATVIKNRMGPPLRTVDYDIYFDSGIDDIGSWLSVMKEFGVLKQSGAWYTYDYNGEELKFMKKDFEEILATKPDVKEHMYSNICNNYIMRYKSTDLDESDLIIDENVPHE